MTKLPSTWKPLEISSIQEICKEFKDWVLCGGHSVAFIAEKDTRQHGDTDIGVFRSQVEECLSAIGREKIYLCQNGVHVAWDGDKVPAEVHDIWITDDNAKHWELQVMVYDDEGDHVIYRRNRSISWPKSSHSIKIGSIQVLNPFVTFLFKSNKIEMEQKEMHDLMLLIETGTKLRPPIDE